MWKLLLVALAAVAEPAAAQGSRLWRPEERIVVSDFTVVDAVAASDAYVFVATANGLGLYDRRFRRWEPPRSIADGYPAEPVVAALADPADESLWLATALGLVHYRPVFREFERIAAGGGVRELMYDREDPFSGLYLRDATGWRFLQRGSMIPGPALRLPPVSRRVGSLSVDRLMSQQPTVDAMSGMILTDERLRTFAYTSAVEVPLTEEYYLGTNGLGLIQYDVLVAQFNRLPFGLLAQGVGAVTVVPGGVWVGTDHRSRRQGFTFVGEDLQRFEYEEGPRATGLGITGVRAMIGRGRDIWAATNAGVVVFQPGGYTRTLRTVQGLPDEETFALAQGPSGVWVGTAFGLALVSDDQTITRIGRTPVPVLALSAARDSVWVGTTDGLAFATPGGDLLIPPDVAANPDLRVAIVAIAQVADTLVVASVDRIMWRAAGEWLIERVISPEIGSIFALAPDSGGVWLGGARGISFYRFATREFRSYLTPGDVPGPVHDVAVSGDYLWVGTEEGLVRFTKSALIP
jgi:ligand-binding sensor domain-containing protein